MKNGGRSVTGVEANSIVGVVRGSKIEQIKRELPEARLYSEVTSLGRDNCLGKVRGAVSLIVGVPFNRALQYTPGYVMNALRDAFRDRVREAVFLVDPDSAMLDLVRRSDLEELDPTILEQKIMDKRLFADNCDLNGIIQVASVGQFQELSRERALYLEYEGNREAEMRSLKVYVKLEQNVSIVYTDAPGFSYAKLFVGK